MMPLSRLAASTTTFALALALSSGCAHKRALLGTKADYTQLPTDEPIRVYGETACPGTDAPKADDPPLDDRLYLLGSGALWAWDGGDRTYMSGHDYSRWTYTKDDPNAKLWLLLVDREIQMGGSATFYVDDLGPKLKLGNLVLMPEDGKEAYIFLYAGTSKLKWKTEKVDDTVRVKGIPDSVPISTGCFATVDEGWPQMEPPISIFYYGSGLEVKALWSEGDTDGARALLKKNDLLNKKRYADEELSNLLTAWSMMRDESLATYPLLTKYNLTDRAALWALIESKYDALVEAGKAPPRAGSEPEPEPAAPAEGEPATPEDGQPAEAAEGEPAGGDSPEAAAPTP